MDLYRFADTAAPKDKFLVFKVTPVIPEACTPPQVMFSSLGIISPPAISTVLRQIRALTEVEGSLDRWTYKHASVETVFSAVFSFLQGNFFHCNFIMMFKSYMSSHIYWNRQLR